MKKLNMILAALLVCGAAGWAAQDTDITSREVRDPRQLETWLEANAANAESRLASLEAVSLTNTTLSSVTLVSNAVAKVYASNIVVKTGGTLTIPAGALANDTVREADLMAVDSASDEDFLSYESTTGDFEWHSAAEIAGKFTEGVLADSIIVTADIKDGDISEADLKAVDTAADEDVMTYESTTGDFEWHSVAEIMGKATEGSLTDSTVVSADIKDGEITAADLAADSVAASELAADSVTKDCMNAEDFGDFTAGSDGTCTLDADVVGASELADDAVTKGSMNAEDFGDFTAGADGTCALDAGVVDDAELAAATVGTAGADATKTHGASALKYVELTITSTNLATLADGAHGGGTLEYTFPAGLIYIVGATATGTVVNSTNFNATTADTYSFGVGTATAGDDDALSSTEQNIINVVTVDTASGSKASQVIYGVSSAAVVVDGTSTAAKVYVNYAVADANNHAGNTFGTAAMKVKIWYVNLGDI